MTAARVEKRGRDVEVGDRLMHNDTELFMVLAFADSAEPGRRVALNCWGEPWSVRDDYSYATLVANLAPTAAAS